MTGKSKELAHNYFDHIGERVADVARTLGLKTSTLTTNLYRNRFHVIGGVICPPTVSEAEVSPEHSNRMLERIGLDFLALYQRKK